MKSFEKNFESFSGCIFQEINQQELKLGKSNSLRGNSYFPLPTKIEDKKVILNNENVNDDHCLLWYFLAQGLNLDCENNLNCVSHYEPVEHDNVQIIEIHVACQKIPTYKKIIIYE